MISVSQVNHFFVQNHLVEMLCSCRHGFIATRFGFIHLRDQMPHFKLLRTSSFHQVWSLLCPCPISVWATDLCRSEVVLWQWSPFVSRHPASCLSTGSHLPTDGRDDQSNRPFRTLRQLLVHLCSKRFICSRYHRVRDRFQFLSFLSSTLILLRSLLKTRSPQNGQLSLMGMDNQLSLYSVCKRNCENIRRISWRILAATTNSTASSLLWQSFRPVDFSWLHGEFPFTFFLRIHFLLFRA